ncbi:MAG: amino acid ABC transporter permease [Hyphomicrobiaceae bacterium]|jgi:polar amino acid transport system permease protein
MIAVADWFRWLYEATGINLTYMYDSFDQARMLKGIWLTLELAVVTIVLSIAIGILGAWLQGSRYRLLQLAVNGFISLFRNTPPLVQIYFFYFGLGYLLPRTFDPTTGAMAPLLTNVQWAIISLSLFAGAFNIEIFRSGIEAVSRSTVEAAESLGFSRWQTYRDVVLPLALRTCLPSLSNNLVNLIKTTNLAYAIAVPEMMYSAKQIWADSTNVTEMMLTVLVFYVAIATLFAWGMTRLERALRVPGIGQQEG